MLGTGHLVLGLQCYQVQQIAASRRMKVDAFKEEQEVRRAELPSDWVDHTGVYQRTNVSSEVAKDLCSNLRLICASSSEGAQKVHPLQCLLFTNHSEAQGQAEDRAKYLHYGSCEIPFFLPQRN